MKEELKEKVEWIKPIIRSILLAAGTKTSEREFRKDYFSLEGESFNVFLHEFQMSFYQFMKSIPDSCRVWKIPSLEGEEVMIERVSTDLSDHMSLLTVVKKKRKPLSNSRLVIDSDVQCYVFLVIEPYM